MLFSLVGSVAFAWLLSLTWRRVRQGALGVVEGGAWSLAWIAGGVLLWRPEITTRVASFFGIGRGADFILYLAVIVLGVAVFLLALSLDHMRREMTGLVQELALRDLPSQENDEPRV